MKNTKKHFTHNTHKTRIPNITLITDSTDITSNNNDMKWIQKIGYKYTTKNYSLKYNNFFNNMCEISCLKMHFKSL